MESFRCKKGKDIIPLLDHMESDCETILKYHKCDNGNFDVTFDNLIYIDKNGCTYRAGFHVSNVVFDDMTLDFKESYEGLLYDFVPKFNIDCIDYCSGNKEIFSIIIEDDEVK